MDHTHIVSHMNETHLFPKNTYFHNIYTNWNRTET